MSRKTGTREWSEHSVNCCLGCRHGCLYCYGREAALRWGKINRGEDWTTERVDVEAANRTRKKYAGRVMFPTVHDLTKGTAAACLATLVNLLDAENDVLVVSKAGLHVPALLDTARSLAEGKGKLELRVSLTCLDGRIAACWEPFAPSPRDRLAALIRANRADFDTSVSIEPCLEPERVQEIVDAALDAEVKGEIWIGGANLLRRRTAWIPDKRDLPLEWDICRIEAGQTPEAMGRIYEALNGNPQIRWKDSYQKVLGIDAKGAKA